MNRLTLTSLTLLLAAVAALAPPAGALQSQASQTGLVFDDVFLRHLAGVSHPERPERLTAIRDGLERTGLLKTLFRIGPRRVTDAELMLVHSPAYVALVRRELSNLKGTADLSTGDTVISPGSLETAQFAAGGVLNAVDAVMTGKGEKCILRRAPAGPSRDANTRHGLLHL